MYVYCLTLNYKHICRQLLAHTYPSTYTVYGMCQDCTGTYGKSLFWGGHRQIMVQTATAMS